MSSYETTVDKARGVTVEIYQDDFPMNPRTEFDNCTTMICFHNRYDLGDSDHGLSSEDFSGWDEIEEYIRKELGAVAILPLYLYDHSGVTISTSPFSCPWDSGRIGFIFITPEQVRAAFGNNPPENLVKVLEADVATYDQYLTGDIWGYSIIETATGEVLESCGGFFGLDYVREEIARALADYPEQLSIDLK